MFFLIVSGRPTLLELVRLRIPQRVCPHYHAFGNILLNDETGGIVETVIKREMHNSERIVMEILRIWFQTSDDVTWDYLIRVLRDIDQSVLAAEIEAKITGIYILLL